jgi:hypothetical protein
MFLTWRAILSPLSRLFNPLICWVSVGLSHPSSAHFSSGISHSFVEVYLSRKTVGETAEIPLYDRALLRSQGVDLRDISAQIEDLITVWSSRRSLVKGRTS